MKLTVQVLAFTLMLLTSFSAFSDDVCHKIKTNTTCQQDDYTALRALYLSADGDNWGYKSGWLTAAEFTVNPTMPAGTDVGTWYGVTTNTDGCVTHLSLVYNGLNGSIPPEIGYLSNLNELNLSSNSLVDADIPSEIGNLSNLTLLDLVHATFESNIPPEIGNLTQLTNVLLFGIAGSIPSEFYNLTQLTHLNLQYDQFTGSISPELGNLTALNDLRLSGVTGNIPPELGNLTNLTILTAYNNQLTGSIPGALGNLTNLEHLYLHNNQLTGSLPSQLGNLSNLGALYLYNNQLTGCYPSSFNNLCPQLDATFQWFDNTNYIMSSGNNFDAQWEDFCNNNTGVCPANACTSRVIDANLVAIGG